MSGRDLPRSATYSVRDFSPTRARTSATTGTFNSRRGVAAPRTHSFGHAPDPLLPSAIPGSSTRGKPKRLDPFLTKVVVKVDEATEPGISEEEGERKRIELVNIVLDRTGDAAHTSHGASVISGGQAVAFALRKRLKSEDEIAVLNTLTLLDELMRTCPYFYRFIANEKFFRRLWRFVVPDYKDGVKSMIPIFGKVRIHQGMRGSGSEISERVRILIRAWAEELSVMQKGRYDPDAGFLMERYNNKRSRVNFPPVPETPLPWVCPVSHGSASSSRRGGKKEEKLTLTLAEVENTVSLFSNIVDNAKSVTDLKDEVCSDMAERCLYIKANLSRMSMNMSKETELTRAIAVSELLEKSLTQYRSSLESGRIVKSIPTVDTISLQSEDEGYGDLDRRQTSSHSLDRYHDSRPRELERRQSRYTDESDHSSAGVVTYPPEDKPYKPRDRSRSPAPRRRESSPDQRRPSNSSIEKRSRRDPKKSLRRREKSDSDLVELAKQKEKMKIKKKKAAIAAAKKDQGLIQLPVEDTVFSSSSDSEDENAAKDGSTLLAERYASRKGSKTSQSQAASSSRSVALNGSLTSVPPTASAASPAVPGSASSAGFPPNPAAMYQSVGSGMGYNPMMMVPNPYAMYGSVNPMPMADPMNMYGAYQTVNPAMYYNTVNPHMYATHHMQMMPGVQPGVGPAHPNPQANAQSADGTPSPGQSSQNMFMPAAPPANAPQAVPQPSFPTPSEPQQSAPNMTTANPGTQAAAMPSHPMASFYSSSAGQAQMGSQGGFPFMMQPASAPAPFLQTAQTDMPAAPDALTVQMSQQNNPNAQAFAYQSAMHQAAAAYHAAAEAYRSVSGQAPIGAPQANNSGNPPMGQNRGGGGD